MIVAKVLVSVLLVIGLIAWLFFVGNALLTNDENKITKPERVKNISEDETLIQPYSEIKSDIISHEKIYLIGETMRFAGIEITLSDLRHINSSELENGKVIQLRIQILNQSKRSVYVHNNEFKLYDSSGKSYHSIEANDIRIDLKNGESGKGTLTYDVSVNKLYRLVYEPTFTWGNDDITWLIQP